VGKEDPAANAGDWKRMQQFLSVIKKVEIVDAGV
jgi:hypothetical protein